MKLFSDLKTSERLSLSFSLFGFLSLLLFLVLVNITYFFIWYSQERDESFQGISRAYSRYLASDGNLVDIQILRESLLAEDTIIIPEIGDVVCSQSLYQKFDGQDVFHLQNNYFYKSDKNFYFIYSRYYKGIGEIKIFFDTTSYIQSQIIIMQVSIVFILLIFLLQFVIGKYISRKLLVDLKNISKMLQDVDIYKKRQKLNCKNLPIGDEIQVLVSALNKSFGIIESQTEKMQQFIVDVSHEFKTPLMAMNSRIDVLEKKKHSGKLAPQDVEKFFHETRMHIQKLNGLLETLFFLTRMQETGQGIEKQELKLKPLLESRIKILRESYAHKDIIVEYEFPDDYTFEAQSQTCSIVFDNLLSNAIKFSPETVHIKISADKNEIKIFDNGSGVPQERKKEIFEKFYRNDTSVEGFGIGLFLVKRILDLYHWDIRVEDNIPRGSIFILKIS